jgi:hypothetical protein
MSEPIDMLQRDERAAEARDLLDNPLLQEIYQKLESEAVEALLRAEPGSSVATASHLRIMALRSIQAELTRLVEDPKMLRAASERRRRLST